MDEVKSAAQAAHDQPVSADACAIRLAGGECPGLRSETHDQLLLIETLLHRVLADRVGVNRWLQEICEQLKSQDHERIEKVHGSVELMKHRALEAEFEVKALRKQLAELEATLTKRSKKYVEQMWQFNRSRVFMSAVRQVLEELLRGDAADHVRQLFASKYEAQIQLAIEKGLITGAPEKSPEFAENMPATRKFILDVLGGQPKKYCKSCD